MPQSEYHTVTRARNPTAKSHKQKHIRNIALTRKSIVSSAWWSAKCASLDQVSCSGKSRFLWVLQNCWSTRHVLQECFWHKHKIKSFGIMLKFRYTRSWPFLKPYSSETKFLRKFLGTSSGLFLNGLSKRKTFLGTESWLFLNSVKKKEYLRNRNLPVPKPPFQSSNALRTSVSLFLKYPFLPRS